MARTRTRKPLGGMLAGLEASTPFEDLPAMGTHCSDCGGPQRESPSGITCERGHGGATSLEETRGSRTISSVVMHHPEPGRIEPTGILVDAAVDKDGVVTTFDHPIDSSKVAAEVRAKRSRKVSGTPSARVIQEEGITTTILDPSAVSKSTKVAHVLAAKQTRDHECHWPGCEEQVEPARWGCKPHWFALPKPIRDAIWNAYAPGQETVMSPSESYLDAADAAQKWIAKFGWKVDPRLAEPRAELTERVRDGFASTYPSGNPGRDRDGYLLQDGEHADDCTLGLGGSCDCHVGYVDPPSKDSIPAAIPTGGNPLDERVDAADVAKEIAAVKDAANRSKSSSMFRSGGAFVRFVPVTTRVLIEAKTFESLAEILNGPKLDGALVKVSVAVASSCRDGFDAVGIKAKLIEHGASAVMMAPRTFADTGVKASAKRAAATAPSAEDAVREWFAGQVGLTEAEREQAIELALDMLGGAS